MNYLYKFRAWIPSQKRMAYQGEPDLETIQSFFFHYGDRELMMYTGCTDDNGKDIYVGDILQQTYTKFEARFEDRQMTGYEHVKYNKIFVVEFKPPTFIIYDYPKVKHEEKFKSIVIGNIYENPELLKKS